MDYDIIMWGLIDSVNYQRYLINAKLRDFVDYNRNDSRYKADHDRLYSTVKAYLYINDICEKTGRTYHIDPLGEAGIRYEWERRDYYDWLRAQEVTA